MKHHSDGLKKSKDQRTNVITVKIDRSTLKHALPFLFYFLTFPILGDDREPGIESEVLPTGQTISPLAAPGAHLDWLNPGLADFPAFVAGGGITTVTSPDQQTLLALTSVHNVLSRKRKMPGSTFLFLTSPAPRQCKNKRCRCRTHLPESLSIQTGRSSMLAVERMTTSTRSPCKPTVPGAKPALRSRWVTVPVMVLDSNNRH